MANLSDEQIELLARQAAEQTRQQAHHSNERLELLEKHKREREAAKIELANVSGPTQLRGQ